MASSWTPLFGRVGNDGAVDVTDKGVSSGARFWVDGAEGTDDAGHGNAPLAHAFDTLAYAFSSDSPTASSGDIIYVAEGHTEAPTTAITIDIAGVTVKGLGSGTSRPQFTGGAASLDVINVTADNTVIEGLYFNEQTVATGASHINIAAANCVVRNCHFDCGAYDPYAITITAAGEKPIIEDCTFAVTANGPVAFIDVEGVIDLPIIRRCKFVGSVGGNEVDTGCIDFSSQAVTNPIVFDCDFLGADDATPTVSIAGASSCVGDCFSGNRHAGGVVSTDTVSTVTATIGAGAITSASFGTGAITAAAIANDAIAAAELANGAIDAATFSVDALAAIEAEAEDALEGENLDHFVKVAVDTDLATTVHANSALGYAMGASDMSTYNRTTDSLEALGTNVAAILADTGTDGVVIADGYITAAKIANGALDADTFASDAKAMIEAECEDALEGENLDHLAATTTSVAADGDLSTMVTDGSILSHIMTAGADTSDYKASTDSLEAISDALAAGTGCTVAIEADNLDHLAAADTGIAADADLTTMVADQSILSHIMTAGADTSDYQASTDSLEAIRNQLDTGTDVLAGINLDHLALTDTGIAADADLTTMVADGAILSHVMTKGADTSDFAASTDSLEAIADKLGNDPGVYFPGLGYCVTKTEDLTDNTTTDDLFDVTGKVLVTLWTMEVATSAVGADLVDYKLRVKTDNIDLCAASDIHGDAIGQMYMLCGDAGEGILGSDSAKHLADANGLGLANRVIGLASGSCTLQSLHTDPNTSTATLKHVLYYMPLEAGAGVVTSAT